MKKANGSLLILVVILMAGCTHRQGMKAFVVMDSSDPSVNMTRHYLIPYLDHFGIAYDTCDIRTGRPSGTPRDYALVIIGNYIKNTGPALKFSRSIISAGAGVVSFDPGRMQETHGSDMSPASAGILTFRSGHYITALHPEADTVRCFHPIPVIKTSPEGMSPVVLADGQPLLLVSGDDSPRRVLFSSMDWMKTEYLGPLMGLDDCLWRSMVWAARKPFAMRGLPPLVTMRVDDVAGRGEVWGKSPFYWVGTAVKYGFKPWLGLFIYNLDTAAVNELRGYLLAGDATQAPHALGRPNRHGVKKLVVENDRIKPGQDFYAGFYYNPDAMPFRETDYDEFIYFNHQEGIPWSDEEALRGLQAADKWYAQNEPFPMSKYLIPHFYEVGNNVISYVIDKWGIEYIAMNKDAGMPYADSVPWIRCAPFRLFEKPGTNTNNPALRGKNPVYYAGFIRGGGRKLFDCITEIRDVAGYEWAPDNDVDVSAQRGIRELRRALSGMDLAVLFTHETDYIYRISPENWDAQMKKVAEGIRDYDPMLLNSDDALRIVRAHVTSRLTGGTYDAPDNNLNLSFSGFADTTSYVYIFDSENGQIQQKLLKLPAFHDGLGISFPLKNGN